MRSRTFDLPTWPCAIFPRKIRELARHSRASNENNSQIMEIYISMKLTRSSRTRLLFPAMLFNVNHRRIFHNFGIFNSRDTIELDVLNTACLLKTVNINFNYLLYDP